MSLNILLCFFFSEGGEEEGHFLDGDMQLEGQEEREAGEAEEVMDQGNDEEFDEIAEFLGINPDQLQIRQDLVDRIAVWLKKGLKKDERENIYSQIYLFQRGATVVS